MKWFYRIILPVLFLISVEAKSQVYNYIPFPDSNMVWMGYNLHCARGSCFQTYWWTYHINGDTVINDYVYHKIERPGSYRLCYFRKDTSKRVFFIEPNDTSGQEKLLYDFSLSVGDTLFGSNWVTRVDTPIYNGIPRRTIHFSSGIKWIEGIGGTNSPKAFHHGNFAMECYAVQDSVIVFESGLEACYYFFPELRPFPDQSFRILPNPTNSYFTLKLSLPPARPTYFLLFDILGREVMREEILYQTARFNRDYLFSGVYVWQVVTGYEILEQGKLVVQ